MSWEEDLASGSRQSGFVEVSVARLLTDRPSFLVVSENRVSSCQAGTIPGCLICLLECVITLWQYLVSAELGRRLGMGARRTTGALGT